MTTVAVVEQVQWEPLVVLVVMEGLDFRHQLLEPQSLVAAAVGVEVANPPLALAERAAEALVVQAVKMERAVRQTLVAVLVATEEVTQAEELVVLV